MFELHLFFLQLAPPIFHPSYISTDFNFTMSGLSNFSLVYLIGVVYKSLVSSIQLWCRKRCQCFLTLSDGVSFSILLGLMILAFEREMKKDVDTCQLLIAVYIVRQIQWLFLTGIDDQCWWISEGGCILDPKRTCAMKILWKSIAYVISIL